MLLFFFNSQILGFLAVLLVFSFIGSLVFEEVYGEVRKFLIA